MRCTRAEPKSQARNTPALILIEAGVTVFVMKKEQGAGKGTGGYQTQPEKEQGDEQPKEQGPFLHHHT